MLVHHTKLKLWVLFIFSNVLNHLKRNLRLWNIQIRFFLKIFFKQIAFKSYFILQKMDFIRLTLLNLKKIKYQTTTLPSRCSIGCNKFGNGKIYEKWTLFSDESLMRCILDSFIYTWIKEQATMFIVRMEK
jgi:hypothetical protein